MLKTLIFFTDNENLAESLVREGLAKVKEGKPSEEKTELLSLQEKAKSEKKGLWDESSLNQVSKLNSTTQYELNIKIHTVSLTPMK